MKYAQYAVLWTATHHPTRAREWSLEKKFKEIKAFGFEGICAPFDLVLASLARKHGLLSIGMLFPGQPRDFNRILRDQLELGVKTLNIQLGDHHLSSSHALRLWRKLEEAAQNVGVKVALETHRDSAAENIEALYNLADQYERTTGAILPIAWDFAQLASLSRLHTGKQMNELLSRPVLIQRASHFHFRPFNAHHSQLPVTHRGSVTPEVTGFLIFATEVMRIWKSDPHNRTRTFFASANLGPRGSYALSSFPPVWEDSLVLAKALKACWAQA